MSEIRVTNIIGETGTDAVKFTKGVNVTGIVTATSFAGIHLGEAIALLLKLILIGFILFERMLPRYSH